MQMKRYKKMDYSVSEIVIRKKEKQLDEWWNLYGNNLPDLEQNINNYLFDGTNESKKILVSFFHDNDFLQHYINTEVIAIMSLFVSAYEMEFKAGIKESILDRKMKISDFVQLYNEIKFYIWHVEFDWENSEVQLKDFIVQKKLSWYLLQFLVFAIAFDKEVVLNKILIMVQKEI